MPGGTAGTRGMTDLTQASLADEQMTGGSSAASAPAPAEAERYLSCRFLERAVTFYPGRVTACCANPASGKTPTIVSFAELSAESLLAGREKIIARHKAGDIHRACQGCPRLTEEEWQRPGALNPYAIDEVTIAHFTSCNIRCNYCYTVTRPELAAPLSKQPRILPAFQQLIERNLLAPDATVRFSGGEPTLSPEFEPLLKLLTNHGVRSVVYTNATKRSEAIMEALAKDKIELVMGIDATTIQTYKAIKKMNYNEKVWKVVAEYCGVLPANATNKAWAKFIFCVENYHEAGHFVERAHAAGARDVYYDFDSSRVYGNAERGGVALPEEICDHLAILRHGCAKRGINVEFAQSGLVWLTPERQARVEREIERLRLQDATAAPPSVEPVPSAPLDAAIAITSAPAVALPAEVAPSALGPQPPRAAAAAMPWKALAQLRNSLRHRLRQTILPLR
jgi:hypothetical protein